MEWGRDWQFVAGALALGAYGAVLVEKAIRTLDQKRPSQPVEPTERVSLSMQLADIGATMKKMGSAVAALDVKTDEMERGFVNYRAQQKAEMGELRRRLRSNSKGLDTDS